MQEDAQIVAARRRLIGIYGLAHFGKSLFWNTSSLIFAFFLTETVGMSPQTMGYVLAASLFFNACLDYGVGRFLSGHVRSAGSAAQAQFLGGLIAAGAFMGFAASGFVPIEVQVIYALATILVFRLGYSLYDVPQNAFMAFAASNDRDRATLASTRYIAAGASILCIALIFAPVIRDANPDRQALRFLQVALGLSAISLLCSSALVWLAFRSSGVLPPSAMHVSGRSGTPAGPLPEQDIYPLLLVAITLLSLSSPAFTKLEAYFTAFALDEPLSALLFMACVAGGKVAAQPAWVWFSRATSLVLTFRTACFCWAFSAVLFFLFGLTEPWGTIVSALLVGASSGGVFMSLWSLLARAAAARPEHTTRRFGLFTFFSKTAQAVGILLLGWALSLFDYKSQAGQLTLLAIMAGAPFAGATLLFAVSFRFRRTARPSVSSV